MSLTDAFLFGTIMGLIIGKVFSIVFDTARTKAADVYSKLMAGGVEKSEAMSIAYAFEAALRAESRGMSLAQFKQAVFKLHQGMEEGEER